MQQTCSFGHCSCGAEVGFAVLFGWRLALWIPLVQPARLPAVAVTARGSPMKKPGPQAKSAAAVFSCWHVVALRIGQGYFSSVFWAGRETGVRCSILDGSALWRPQRMVVRSAIRRSSIRFFSGGSNSDARPYSVLASAFESLQLVQRGFQPKAFVLPADVLGRRSHLLDYTDLDLVHVFSAACWTKARLSARISRPRAT